MKQLFAALILTAAALATPSAFGYGVIYHNSDNWGFAVNIDSQAEANRIALQECLDSPETRVNCERNRWVLNNMCVNVWRTLLFEDVTHGRVSVIARVEETTRELAESAVPATCVGAGDDCSRIPLGTRDICDHTCDFDEFARDSDTAGCGECTDPNMPIGEGEDCRAIKKIEDCVNLRIRNGVGEIYPDGNNGCRAALECEADNSITNDSGGCMPCDADETETGTENICVDIPCESPRTIENRVCVCNEDDFDIVGESCLPKCDEETETRVGETCMPNEDMGKDPVGGDMTEPPEFTIEAGGMNLTTTVDDGHEVAFDDVLATKITVATTVAGFTYTKTGESSSELTVGLTDGVVGFTSTVAANDYRIFVAAANNNTVVATISLYLTVAEMVTGGDGGNGGDGGDNGNDGNNGGTTTSSGGGGGGSAAGIIGGVVVVALALWYFTSGSDDLTWTPSYAFRNNNGNVSYSVGSRWTATANDWQIYWQTRQTDKFVYGSGIGYNNGILSAAMNSESEGKQTALDLDFAANKTIGLWNLGGGYRFDMQLSETETDTQNRINAKVRYTMDKWILSANANTDGDTGTARINYSYRF